MKAIVSEKGQVTIPKALRDRLGIRPGETLDFDEDGGRLIATKCRDRLADVRSLIGIVDIGMTTDEFMEVLRGPRDEP